MCNEKVPIYHKVCLTIEEASEYSNIGINKMQSIAANPRCSFVLYVGYAIRHIRRSIVF